MLHYLKGLRSPFCFSSTDIKLASACKKSKEKQDTKRVLHEVVKYLPAACKRVADCLYSKRESNTFGANCMLNPQMACNLDNVSNMALGEYNLKFQNVGKF
jgi:hypothetical protein